MFASMSIPKSTVELCSSRMNDFTFLVPHATISKQEEKYLYRKRETFYTK